MLKLLIKKVFFDIWDNFLYIILLNLGYMVPIALFFIMGSVNEKNTMLAFLILVLAVLIFSFYSLCAGAVTYNYSRYKRDEGRAFLLAFKDHIGHAFIHFGLCAVLLAVFLYGVPFYFSLGLIGYVLGILTFWIAVYFVLAMQYFYALCFHNERDGALATLKKSFMLVSDNLGATLFLFIRTIIDIALSVVTGSLLPGFSGIMLSRMDTVRLLMKKYDFLEANPQAELKDVNWEDLLYEEKLLVGPRSFRGMIFPWKE